MTDEELIARLRWKAGAYAKEAADRIEALTKERDEALAAWKHEAGAVKRFAERHERHLVMCAEVRVRAERAEAKLAKAEAGLREIAGECGCFIARTTLAEIKGESHE